MNRAWSIGCAVVLASAGAAGAQYITDFESLNASDQGVVLTGQDGYYLPNTSSVDFKAYTYAGNALNIPANPGGSARFIAGVGPGDGAHVARAQRDMTLDSAGWVFEFDLCAGNGGQVTGANNIGSFSLQPHDATPTHKTFIAVGSYVDVADPTVWRLGYVIYTAEGNEASAPGVFGGVEWQQLKLWNWYRFSTTVDFSTNAVTRISMRDITGGGPEIAVNPVGWYLRGGAASPYAIPTAVRFFAGANIQKGNLTAWDNCRLAHAEDGCFADCDGSGELDVDDFICFQTLFGLGDPGADCDGSGELDIDDFICYQTAFGIGCG